MVTKDKLRKSILNKVKKLSEDKLSNLDSYMNDLNSEFSTEQSTLSFGGVFEELELNDLTTEFHRSRTDNNNRIPQF